jgi:hypothetical protein
VGKNLTVVMPSSSWIFEGAAISHLIPAVVNARDNPNPVGPAS